MNKKLQIPLLFLLALSVVSIVAVFAKKSDPQPLKTKIHPLSPVNTYSCVDDTLFLGNVTSMVYDEEHKHLYLSERDNGRVLKVAIGEKLSLVQQFGRPGLGPGEFYHNQYLQLKNDALYVQEGEAGAISKWSKQGDLLKELSIPVYRHFDVDAEGNVISYNPFTKEYPLVVYDTNGEKRDQFGEYHEPIGSQNIQYANYRFFAISDEGYIYSISTQHAIIDKYDSHHVLVDRYDLSKENAVIKNSMTIQRNRYLREYKSGRGKIYYENVGNVELKENMLYINYRAYSGKATKYNSRIYLICIDLLKDEMKEHKTYYFDEESFDGGAFCCIGKDSIATYNRMTGNVEIYRLN